MALLDNLTWHNLTNLTVNGPLEAVFELSVKLTAVIGTLQIVLGLFFNLFLLAVLLGKKELRCDVRNMLIASLAGADLFAVVVLLPVDVFQTMQRNWILGCYPHMVFQLLYLFAFSFVSAWGIVCLDSLLLARVCHLGMPLTSFLTSAVTTSISVWKRRLDRAVVVVVISLPWVLSVIVITPIVFTGLHEFHKKLWTSQRCDFILVRWALITLNTLFFFLPCILVFLLLSISACVFCYRRRRGGTGTITPTMPPTITTLGETSSAAFRDRPCAYLVASVLTFLLMGPRHFLSMLSQFEGLPALADVPTWVIVNFSLKWLSESKSVCLPLVWLCLLPEVRAQACHLLTLTKRLILRVKDEPRFDPSVSYKNLDS